LASSEGSNFSSLVISAALGAVPRVAREPDSSEPCPSDPFELTSLELVDSERVLESGSFDLVDFDFEPLELELPARGFREPVLCEREDLELPADLLSAIPRSNIPTGLRITRRFPS
jgi:hypothetical protein